MDSMKRISKQLELSKTDHWSKQQFLDFCRLVLEDGRKEISRGGPTPNARKAGEHDPKVEALFNDYNAITTRIVSYLETMLEGKT